MRCPSILKKWRQTGKRGVHSHTQINENIGCPSEHPKRMAEKGSRMAPYLYRQTFPEHVLRTSETIHPAVWLPHPRYTQVFVGESALHNLIFFSAYIRCSNGATIGSVGTATLALLCSFEKAAYFSSRDALCRSRSDTMAKVYFPIPVHRRFFSFFFEKANSSLTDLPI